MALLLEEKNRLLATPEMALRSGKSPLRGI